MDANVMLQAVATVGFPIVVCGYVMVVGNRKIDDLTQAINNMSKSIVSCPLKEG